MALCVNIDSNVSFKSKRRHEVQNRNGSIFSQRSLIEAMTGKLQTLPRLRRGQLAGTRVTTAARVPSCAARAFVVEAYRPYDGTARNGVATLSSGGAGSRRGTSGRRVTDGKSRQRLRIGVARPRSSVAARFGRLSRLLGTLQGERAHARPFPFSLLVIHTFSRSLLSPASRLS